MTESKRTTYKMLGLSTSHLPYGEKDAADKWAAYKSESGWVFWASLDYDDFYETAPILAHIIKWADNHEYDYVMLDAHEGDCEDLPTFLWPTKVNEEAK